MIRHETIAIFINDQRVETEEGASLLEALQTWPLPAQPFVLALNQVFIPGSQYSTTCLQKGDRIELVVAVQGG